MVNYPPTGDKFHEECGVFGIWNTTDAAALATLALNALQHRGQEAAGIASMEGETLHLYKKPGLVGDIFSKKNVIKTLKGTAAIAHNRYSTTGASNLANIQPMAINMQHPLVIAHNGNLTNAQTLKKSLKNVSFQSTTDTEIILHLIAQSSQKTILSKLTDSLCQLHGGFALVLLTTKELIGIKDPLGIRPLVIGKLGKNYLLASETCAFNAVGATFIRDVKPGEIVIINDNGLTSHPLSLAGTYPSRGQERFCIFEYIYFARPDSTVGNRNVYKVRKNIGRQLAQEAPINAHMVVAVPDSGNPAALGYAQKSDIPLEFAIIRNHYIGRTFIEPKQHIRNLSTRIKHSPNATLLKGKKIVLVDDSIVRGTTAKRIMEYLRAAGVAEIHFRIASPPNLFPCFYGVDTPQRKDLIAAHKTPSDIASFIGCDSLHYLSLQGLKTAILETEEETNKSRKTTEFCDACLTGHYPSPLVDKIEQKPTQTQLSLK